MGVEAFTDVDWLGSLDDERSTVGYCTFMVGNLVTRRSMKHSLVARSIGKPEFRVVAHEICELLWLKILIWE